MIKVNMKRKPLQKTIRISIIAILSIIVILSAYVAIATFQQQPKTIEKTVPTCEYGHSGNFNYIVYLKNNTVYNGASVLYPEQGTIFKKITDHIKASFTYRFYCDQSASIDGDYTVTAQIQTNIWTKEYVVIPKTEFTTSQFSVDFPIDYIYYEDIVATINNETGVNAGTPTLNMTCSITVSASTSPEAIYDSFSHTLSMPLLGNIVEFDGNLTKYQSKYLEGTVTVSSSGINEQQSNGGIMIFIFLIALITLILVFMFTESKDKFISSTEKQIQKIKKKYGEWIVEVEKPPMHPLGADIVSTKTLDDLIKVSEELGKPLIYYFSSSDPDKNHAFYVLDEKTQYEYALKSK